jgi:hypothetical protein
MEPAVDTIRPDRMNAAHLARNTLIPTMRAAFSFWRMQRRLKPNFDFAMKAVSAKVMAANAHMTR